MRSNLEHCVDTDQTVFVQGLVLGSWEHLSLVRKVFAKKQRGGRKWRVDKDLISIVGSQTTETVEGPRHCNVYALHVCSGPKQPDDFKVELLLIMYC